MTTEKKPYQWLAWCGTVSVLITASMASINLYPWYVYGYIFCNTLWIIIGYLWKEKTIMLTNLGVNIIFITGLFFR